MKFRVVIIFIDHSMQRITYENTDMHDAINHSIKSAQDNEKRRIVETIMIEFLEEGLSV